MIERKFEIWIDSRVVASKMDLEDALLFVEAIFDKYYNDNDICISIRPMEEEG